MSDLLGVVFRVSIAYLFTLAMLRLTGKRSIDHLSPLDLMVALIIGDLFDDIFWAEVTLAEGLVAIFSIMFLHALMAYLENKSDWVYRLLTSIPTPVIREGQLVQQGLQKERIRREEVLSEMRLSGESEEELDEIHEGNLEPGGSFSLLKKEEAKEVQKKDLNALKEVLR